MVIWSGQRDVIGGFFGEDRGIVSEFQGKDLFRSCLFSSGSEFCGCGDFGYLFFQGRALVEEVGSTSDDSMEGSVYICAC